MKYRVTVPLHASTHIDVDADSKEDALEKATEIASAPCLCHSCAGKVDMDSVNDEAMYDIELVEEIHNS